MGDIWSMQNGHTEKIILGKSTKTRASWMNNADGPQGAVFSVKDPNCGFPKLNLSLGVFGHH